MYYIMPGIYLDRIHLLSPTYTDVVILLFRTNTCLRPEAENGCCHMLARRKLTKASSMRRVTQEFVWGRSDPMHLPV